MFNLAMLSKTRQSVSLKHSELTTTQLHQFWIFLVLGRTPTLLQSQHHTCGIFPRKAWVESQEIQIYPTLIKSTRKFSALLPCRNNEKDGMMTSYPPCFFPLVSVTQLCSLLHVTNSVTAVRVTVSSYDFICKVG